MNIDLDSLDQSAKLFFDSLTDEQKQSMLKIEEVRSNKKASEKKSKFDFLMNEIRTRSGILQDDMKTILKNNQLAAEYVIYQATNVYQYNSLHAIRRLNEVRGASTVEHIAKSYEDLEVILYSIYGKLCLDFNLPQSITEVKFKDGIKLYGIEASKKILNEMIEDLKYDGTSFDKAISKLKELVSLFSNEDDDVQELHAVSLYYAIASIKNAVMYTNRKPLEPKMIYLYGDQGIGKSLLTKFLTEHLGLENINHFTTFIHCLQDKKMWPTILSNAVTTVDEFSMLSGTLYNDFKSIVTFGQNNVRQNYTSTNLHTDPVTTFIVSSNLPVNKTIQDVTGNRRTWQIHMSKEIDPDELKKDGDLNHEYARELFRIVDEVNFEEIYKEYKPSIKKQQELLSCNPLIVEFTNYYKLVKSVDKNDVVLSGAEMRRIFHHWVEKFNKGFEASRYNIYSKGMPNAPTIVAPFGLALKDLIPKSDKLIDKKKHGATQYLVKCNDDFEQILSTIRNTDDGHEK